MGVPVPVEIGQRYGRLTALAYPVRVNGVICGTFLCECGKRVDLRASCVARGRLVSCGCRARAGLNEGRVYKHGKTGSSEYMIWAMAKDRCRNPNNPSYPAYGGRGIAMTPDWANDFCRFYEDMGPRPSKKHSIERLDVNGNYEPGNCVWATYAEQNRNYCRNVYIHRNGKRYVLTDLARAVGLRPNVAVCRRLRLGWPEARWFEPFTVEEAVDAFDAGIQMPPIRLRNRK